MTYKLFGCDVTQSPRVRYRETRSDGRVAFYFNDKSVETYMPENVPDWLLMPRYQAPHGNAKIIQENKRRVHSSASDRGSK